MAKEGEPWYVVMGPVMAAGAPTANLVRCVDCTSTFAFEGAAHEASAFYTGLGRCPVCKGNAQAFLRGV